MKKGDTFEAPIAVSKARKLGFVKNPDTDEDIAIFIDDIKHALPGDTVKVEMTGEKTNDMDRAIVLEVVNRLKTKFVGVVDKTAKCFVKPDSQRMYVDIFLPADECSRVEHDDKVFVEITTWTDEEKNPTGKLLEVLGKKGIHEVEMRAIVLDKGFDADFPSKVLEEAEELKKKWHNIPEEEIAKRRDMREITTFTIDPADAKDFDDALSFKKLDNGNYEIGVHIADVSHYVTKGTALDKEGLDRAFSVYLVDRTIPMLPEVLSNDLCSLNPNEDKLAFSAVFELTPEAHIKNKWFGRTVINSNKRFAYETAQKVLDGSFDLAQDKEYKEELDILNDLALKLESEKNRNGAIIFVGEEFQFELDENGVPLKIVKKQPLATHKLIENFMLLANRNIAKFIFDSCKNENGDNACALMYRVHNVPDKDKIAELAVFVNALGHKLHVQQDGSVTARDLNDLLAQVKGKPEESLVSTAAIRTMTKALYSTENSGHFGLSFDFYTHFTSPIRRYPDLVVHRIVAKLLKGGKITPNETGFYNEVAVHSSTQEVAAQDAERTSIKYKQVEFMQKHVGEVFEGMVSGVAPFGCFVILDDTGAEGMVHISKLGEDFWQYDEKNYRIVGEKTGKKVTLGDKVKVKIEGADLDQRKLDMRIVE